MPLQGFPVPCLWSRDPLVGSTDPLVGSTDLLIGSRDPLVGSTAAALRRQRDCTTIVAMSVDELVARFPEIPVDLRDEPVLAEFAAKLGGFLSIARRPSNCSTGHDAGNHFYVKLIGPLTYYGYGLATRERVVEDLRQIIDDHEADPDGYAATLLPDDVAPVEVKGPGCE